MFEAMYFSYVFVFSVTCIVRLQTHIIHRQWQVIVWQDRIKLTHHKRQQTLPPTDGGLWEGHQLQGHTQLWEARGATNYKPFASHHKIPGNNIGGKRTTLNKADGVRPRSGMYAKGRTEAKGTEDAVRTRSQLEVCNFSHLATQRYISTAARFTHWH